MNNKRQIFILSILAITCMTSSFAATPIDLAQQPLSILKPFLTQGFLQSSLQQVSQLEEVNKDVDFNQTTHVRYKQTYAGLPVWGGDVVVHIPRGGNPSAMGMMAAKSATMSGLIYEKLPSELGNLPAHIFESGQADKALQQAVNGYQKKTGNKNSIEQQQTNLMVYIDQNNQAHAAFLISFLTTPTNGMPTKPTYIMDATTFEIYQEWDNIQTVDNVDGGGFGGNPKMGQLSYDGLGNALPKLNIQRDATTKICYLKNADVTVKDIRQKDAVVQFTCETPDPAHANIYWNGDHDAINGGYSPSNDALYAGRVIKDMYQNWYGIPVLTENGKPMMLNMRVHDNVENAYWDGSQMTFGDGGSMFYPLVSLGVGAHEVSHGFTEQHSGLVYFNQMGGLNESFSDMAAQAAEFYSSGHNSWQIGSEIMKGNGALRYMDEPTKDCNGRTPGTKCSISNANDFHFGLDVHYSSGVFNKVFYLIGTSAGWDTRKAFDVMVQANRNYWTSLSNFSNAACGVVKATRDYNYSVDAVKNAFTQVGIDTARC